MKVNKKKSEKRRKNNHTTASTKDKKQKKGKTYKQTNKHKNDCKNSRDISDPFSGVVGSVGSVPRWFPLFNFFCLLVSSVSDFHPDTGQVVVDTFFFFFRLTCSVTLWGGRDAANK